MRGQQDQEVICDNLTSYICQCEQETPACAALRGQGFEDDGSLVDRAAVAVLGKDWQEAHLSPS